MKRGKTYGLTATVERHDDSKLGKATIVTRRNGEGARGGRASMESAVDYTHGEAAAASALHDRLVDVERTERLLRNAHSSGVAVQRARQYAIARQEAETALARFVTASFGAQMTVLAPPPEGFGIERYREERS